MELIGHFKRNSFFYYMRNKREPHIWISAIIQNILTIGGQKLTFFKKWTFLYWCYLLNLSNNLKVFFAWIQIYNQMFNRETNKDYIPLKQKISKTKKG